MVDNLQVEKSGQIIEGEIVMKLKTIGIVVMTASLLLGLSQTTIAREPPVAKMVQIEGQVEYTRNGKRWNPVRRTKYLFPGYKIKTGANGSGKLINQQTGESLELGSDSVIEVTIDGIALVSGNLTEPQSESVSVFQSLMNKFAKAQRYTTVRRSLTSNDDKVCDNKVRTIRKISLSPAHPDLVWRNACPEFSYRLIIDGAATDISAQSTSEMIRHTISGIEPGEHSYRVEVLDKDGTVYIPRKDSTFVWVSGKDEKEMVSTLDSLNDDVFMQTNYLEEKGMYVAAMDAYRDYFSENPDDNDMRPLLIQSYNDLKLTNLKQSEARLYNAVLEKDY
jgi:hypothetical protein